MYSSPPQYVGNLEKTTYCFSFEIVLKKFSVKKYVHTSLVKLLHQQNKKGDISKLQGIST